MNKKKAIGLVAALSPALPLAGKRLLRLVGEGKLAAR
jgi:hypothetical protein